MMNKIFKTLLFATLGLLALASCEDVPAPYIVPDNGNGNGNNENTETLIGDGTFSNPYNVAAANKATSELQQSNTSESHFSNDVYVKGIISKIESIDTGQYGNATYYISDDGKTDNQLEVYRGYGFDGAKFKSESDIQVGDTVIVFGKLQNWLGKTYEFTTGSTIVYLNGKTTDHPTPGPTPDGEAKGSGTATDPYNVVAANVVISKLQESKSKEQTYLSDEVFVKGVISKINEVDTGQYGNATYFISDDGTENGQLEIYRGYSLGGEKFKSANEIQKGDTVIVCGKLQNWLGTYEFTQGSKIVELNGKGNNNPNPNPDPQSGEAKGDGTAQSPYNVAGVNKFMDGGNYSGKEVYIEGIISAFNEKEKPGNSYGNATFYISDDGKTTSQQFYIFRTYGFNGEKFTSEDQLKVGDKVVVRGKLKLYNETRETDQGGVLISVNGKEEYSQGGNTPGSSTGDEGNSITFSEKGYSNSQDFDGQSIPVGDATLSWSKGSGSTTPKYYNTGTAMRLYGGNTLTISSQKTISQIKFTYGEDYNGTSYTPTANDSSVTPEGYNYSTHTWTGNANSVVLTRTATTGHFRIVSISISYAE